MSDLVRCRRCDVEIAENNYPMFEFPGVSMGLCSHCEDSFLDWWTTPTVIKDVIT